MDTIDTLPDDRGLSNNQADDCWVGDLLEHLHLAADSSPAMSTLPLSPAAPGWRV